MSRNIGLILIIIHFLTIIVMGDPTFVPTPPNSTIPQKDNQPERQQERKKDKNKRQTTKKNEKKGEYDEREYSK